MKVAIILVGLVAQAFGTGLFSEVIHKTQEAGHEIGHGIHDGVQTITGRSSAAELLHHLNQGYNEAQGVKESAQNLVGLRQRSNMGKLTDEGYKNGRIFFDDRSGLIQDAYHHVKQGAHEAALGAHDAIKKVTGRSGLRPASSSSSESIEQGRIGACSLCAVEKASDKVSGVFSAIKDSITSPSAIKTRRSLWNLGGLLGSDATSLETESGTKVTKVTESKVVAPPKTRGLLDIFGGSSSSNEQKVVKEVHNVAHDLHGNKLAEQSQKLVAQKQRIFGFGSWSSEENQKVVKDTKQVLDSQGRPIAATNKIVEHKNRFLGLGSSSAEEEPKKIVKEVTQVLNALGQPVSTTSKIIQHKERFLGLGSSEEPQKFVQQTQQLVDGFGRPIAAVTKFVEKGRFLGLGGSSEAEPNQKVIKETHEILNDYGQKVGTVIKYHETLKQ